jgi:nucleotide-binding universal stress UspA family protein
MQSTILVPLDGSAFSEQALSYVEALARTTSVHVVLVQVAPEHVFRGTEITVPAPYTVAEARTYLDGLAALLRRQGVTVEISVPARDDFAATILDEVRAREADLVVMSTHGRSGPGRWLYGSVAEAVLKQSSVPVLLIPPDSVPPWSVGLAVRILVALDGSPHAEAVLAPTCVLAEQLGAELILLQVLDTPSDQAEAYLARVAERLEVSVRKISIRTAVGKPAVVIAETAQAEQANMIAMATHGHTGLAEVVLGSIATATLRRTRVPLFVVRPTGALARRRFAARASTAT